MHKLALCSKASLDYNTNTRISMQLLGRYPKRGNGEVSRALAAHSGHDARMPNARALPPRGKTLKVHKLALCSKASLDYNTDTRKQ